MVEGYCYCPDTGCDECCGYYDCSKEYFAGQSNCSMCGGVWIFPPPPTTGDLSISSTPSGAKIFIDGADTGFVAPKTITGLTPGTHSYKLTLSGYYDITGSFDITAGATTTVSVTLTPLPATGDLSISSSPSGAKIFIDGLDTGFVTPKTITGLTPGTHSYKLTKSGYYDVVGTADIFANMVTTLTITLTPIPLIGELSVNSAPAGAKIYINNVLQEGIVTPALFTGVTEGSYELKLTLTNYNDYVTPFTITAGLTTTINAVLTPAPGSLYIESSPAGARIYIDGVDKGIYTPSTLSLPAGSHTYKLTASGYYDATGSFVINSNVTTTVSVTMTKLPQPGTLQISSSPSGAKVYVDNEDKGVVTPAILTNILEGTHTYKLTLYGYYDAIGTFDITAGATTTISITLTRIPQPGTLQISSIPSGATVFIDGVNKGVTTPALIENILEGAHTYKLSLAGYKDATGDFTIVAGTTTYVSRTLELLPPPGTLQISSTPSGARVYVDDVDKGTFTPASISIAEEGAHTYRLVLAGYVDAVGTFNITSGQTTTISATLAPALGSLSVVSSPSNASIFINDVDSGVTPKIISGMSLGTYSLRLTLEGYHDYVTTFDILAGQMTSISAVLELITHKECVSGKCVDVEGAGTDKCAVDADCYIAPPPSRAGAAAIVVGLVGMTALGIVLSRRKKYGKDIKYRKAEREGAGYA